MRSLRRRKGLRSGGQSFDKWSLAFPVTLADASESKDSDAEAQTGPFPDIYTMTSLAGDKCLYRAEDFDGFTDIYDRFTDWCLKYIEANSAVTPMDKDRNATTYCLLYKGDEHYNQMSSALNGDAAKVQKSIRLSGREYEEMHLMADHGLCVELSRAKIQGDLVLYSGITDAFVERIAGAEPGTEVTTEDLVGAIGTVYEEKAMISTAANFDVSAEFASSKYGAMIFILASQEAMNALGTYCIDCFMGAYSYGGEHEILFAPGARFKVLDVGKADRIRDFGPPALRTYITMELLEEEQDPSTPLDEELGKTSRGDMFNLANNVKVTWKEVPGAKYYKVYREGITEPSESLSEPVIVTSKLVGWDKEPGLTDGHAYRYKIGVRGRDEISYFRPSRRF